MNRLVVLDTETTGLDPKKGHRIIEIGCVEVINRRVTRNHFHYYINPDRDIDPGAIEVHGITRESLKDKPRFEEIVMPFLDYIKDSELVIHNAPFDVGFLDEELKRVGSYLGKTAHYAKITDTLAMARQKHPGQKNNLDALCKRYGISNDHRALHGALLDAEILAHVYLAMTRGQASLLADDQTQGVREASHPSATKQALPKLDYKIVTATVEEAQAHTAMLEAMKKTSGVVVWQEKEQSAID